jgi:hypothetical protein
LATLAEGDDQRQTRTSQQASLPFDLAASQRGGAGFAVEGAAVFELQSPASTQAENQANWVLRARECPASAAFSRRRTGSPFMGSHFTPLR